MSDKDSDNQQNSNSNKLQLQALTQNNSNLFSYKNRSDKDSSSQHDARSNDGSEQNHISSNKLSDMLQFDQVMQVQHKSDEDQDNIIIKQQTALCSASQNVTTNKNEEKQSDMDITKQQKIEQVQQKQQKEVEKIVEQPQNKIIVNIQEKQNNQQNQQLPFQTKIQNQVSKQVKEQLNQQINQQVIAEKVQISEQKQIQKQEIKLFQSFQTKQKDISNGQRKQLVGAFLKTQLKSTQSPEKTQNKEKDIKQINKNPTNDELKLLKQQNQRAYQKELENQMNNMKQNNMKKKTSDKNDKNDKNKLNKTLISFSSSRQFQQTPQYRAIELKMISTMMLQKKRQNFTLLKQWDRRRAESLAHHRNMIQILQSEVDKRIKSSIQNLEIYTTFFRERAKQEQKYVQHPVINTKYALQNNSISKNVYINCTVILNSLIEENIAKCRKINDFILIIRNDILRDCIQDHLAKSQRQLLKIREKISSLKAALRKSNTQTEQKTTQLNVYFNQNAISLNIDTEKDFYSNQIDFLQKAANQTNIQKKLGQYCLQYLQTAMNQQIKRSRVIRDAMVTFTKALQQCYNIDTDPGEIEQLSKAEQTKLIEQFYSLQYIFDERCLTMFKTSQKIDQETMLTLDLFDKFLKKFEFEGFDCKVILLKEYNVRYYPSSKNQSNKQQNCYLVITVDKFIHLFLSKEKTDLYARPDVSVKCTMKNLELKSGKGQILDIIIKEEKRNSMISYFWESKNDRIYRVEFQKRDARQQFIDYVTKIRG